MRRFVPPLVVKHTVALGILCWCMIGLIAYVDYAIVHTIALSSLYLLPLCIGSWIGGFAFGIAIAVAATLGWLIDCLHNFPRMAAWQYAWDISIKLGTWSFIVLLITELKRTLIVARYGFFNFLDTALPPMYTTDHAGRLIYTNPRVREYFNNHATVQDIEQHLTIRSISTSTAPDGFNVDECYDKLNDRWYLRHITHMPWIDGRNVILHVLLDITPQKEAQALARQQQDRLDASARLITLGGMASALAHELNQPLAAIVNYLQGSIRLLNAGNPNPQALLDAMDKASRQAERAGVILRYARTLTQKRDPQFAQVDINRVISDLSDIFQDSAQRHHVHFALNLSSAPLLVNADRIMLEQLITNLVRNGIEAMYETPTDTRTLSIATTRRDEGTIELCVTDTGAGLPPELMDNLFSPFFTTKPTGLGLGLNLCRSIAEVHRGRLWATPNGTQGSVFHLSLPAHAEENRKIA